MAGLPLQVGDMIAMATLAKTVIEYGWGRYSNAGRFPSFSFVFLFPEQARPGRSRFYSVLDHRRWPPYKRSSQNSLTTVALTNKCLVTKAKQHDEFYRDVEALYRSLLALDDIIRDADRGLKQQLANIRLRCDWRSLSEIIGDCKSTLDDCRELLSRNKRFADSSGPVQNIEWNIFVQSDIKALRQRVRQHVEKISIAKDVLKL